MQAVILQIADLAGQALTAIGNAFGTHGIDPLAALAVFLLCCGFYYWGLKS